MLRALSQLAAALVLAVLPLAAGAVSPPSLTWDQLHILVGKEVAIPMHEGCAVSGKVVEVQPDALVVKVVRTSHPATCPKGLSRVPRPTLYVLDLHSRGKKFRVMGTALGFLAGAAGGLGVAIAIQGGVLSDYHGAGAGVAAVAVTGGLTAAGYAIGRSADRRTTTIHIVR